MKWAIPLLATPSASLRIRVLCDLLGRPDDDPEVQELIGLRLEEPMISELLRLQRDDGSWESVYLPGGATGDALWATSQTLARLGFLGFDQSLPAIVRGAAFLFSQQVEDGSWPLFRSHERDGGKVDGGYDVVSLQTSMPLRGLAATGYATDARAEKAYDWLLAQRLPDGAWPTGMIGGNLGYVAGYRRLPHSRWGCRTNTTAALICLAHHPERSRGEAARRGLDLLLGRETRERHHVGLEVARMIGVEPAAGRFTYFARFDAALVLDLCWRIGATAEDVRVADLVAFLRSLQGDYGLWELQDHPEASRWISLDLLRSLSRLEASADWHSTEPRTPFRPYNPSERRY